MNEAAALRTENARAGRALMTLMAIVERNESRLARALTALELLRKALAETYAKPADSLLVAITIADLTLKPERAYLAAVAELSNSPRSGPAPEVTIGDAGADKEGAPTRDGPCAPAVAVDGSLYAHDRSAPPVHGGSARGDLARSADGTALASTNDRNLPTSSGPEHSMHPPQGEGHGS